MRQARAHTQDPVTPNKTGKALTPGRPLHPLTACPLADSAPAALASWLLPGRARHSPMPAGALLRPTASSLTPGHVSLPERPSPDRLSPPDSDTTSWPRSGAPS